MVVVKGGYVHILYGARDLLMHGGIIPCEATVAHAAINIMIKPSISDPQVTSHLPSLLAHSVAGIHQEDY